MAIKLTKAEAESLIKMLGFYKKQCRGRIF